MRSINRSSLFCSASPHPATHSPRTATGSARFQSGFTLIELLVVILIVSILAAALFPVFVQAREKARQANCLSNLKKLGTASMIYVEDYDERYPYLDPTYSGKSARALMLPSGVRLTKNKVWAWPLQFYPYVNNQAVFICPSDPYQGNYSSRAVPDPNTNSNVWDKPFPVSYVINEEAYRGGISQATVAYPTTTYFLGDGHPDFMSFGGWGWTGAFNRLRFPVPCADVIRKNGMLVERYPGKTSDSCVRHNGGNVVMFMDGHARYIPWQRLDVTKGQVNRAEP